MKQTGVGGYILAISAVFLWSLHILVARQFMTALTPIEFAFGRWVFALIILLPMGWNGLSRHWLYFKTHRWWLLGLAVSGIVLENTLIYMAAHTVGATDLSLLNLLGPLFLVLLTRLFLKEKLHRRQAIGFILSVIGVGLVLTRGQWQILNNWPLRIGDLWMVLNGLCFAVYSFLQLMRPRFISQITLLTATVTVGVILLFPLFLVMENYHIRHLTPVDYGLFVYLGVFNSVLAYLAWNKALALIGPVRAGAIYYFRPLFSMAISFWILSIPITGVQMVGGALVIGGVTLVTGKLEKNNA